MNLDEKLFNKIEKKTKVDKNTIINLAKKIEQGNLKDESTLREVIYTLSSITKKPVSKEKEDKIINTILQNKVPSSIDKMF